MTPAAPDPADASVDEPSSTIDLRLLLPAGLAWVSVALTLGLGPVAHLALAGVVLTVVLALLSSRGRVSPGAGRHRSRPRGGTLRTGRRAGGPALAALTLAVTGLLHLSLGAQQLLLDRGDLRALATEGAAVTLEGRIVQDPVARVAGLGEREQITTRVHADLVLGRGMQTRVDGLVEVSGGPVLRGAEMGSTVRVRGILSPALPTDPTVATLRVSGAPTVLAAPGLLDRAALRLRAGLREAVRHAPEDARGLLPGLVIGDTSATPADLTAAMQATGMTHLTAVSGSNVAVVLLMTLALCRLLFVPRWLRPVLALVAITGFVILARPEPSVLRAAAMGGIGVLGTLGHRRSAGAPLLGAAVALVLTVDPWLARSFGFALSTLATVGILTFTRPWGAAIARRLPARCAGFGMPLAVPLAAQVACAPLVVVLQGSVSLVGIVTNLCAGPLVAPATVGGVLAALLSACSDKAAQVVALGAALPTEAVAWLARTGERVPGGTLPWLPGAPGAFLLATLTVLALLASRRAGLAARARPLVAVAAVVAVVAAFVPTTALTWPPERWRAVFCDVGQGDAAVLRTGPRSAVVVDTGPDPALVDGCLRRLDITTVDALVLTHYHADHVGGLRGVLDGRVVRQVVATPVRDPPARADEVSAEVGARGIPLIDVGTGATLDFGDLHAQVWAPRRRIVAGSVPNNASVVLAATVGTVDVLLTGDIEREAGRDLLLSLRRDPRWTARARTIDVLKVPHHGSANLDPELLAAVRSPVAVISVGAENDYGHPAPSTMALLRVLGFAVLRTDQRGDIAVLDDGGAVRTVSMR